MPFPYTFPFVFDGPIDLAAAEAGSGMEAAAAAAVLISGDACGGLDVLKAMLGAAGSGMKLSGHAGRVGMPSKGVKL